ncbi:MAG: protein translocase subunit SecF [Spirochaetales bacterium]|nr:protein translocase subunit SecF [Spirochaetales bacterium]
MKRIIRFSKYFLPAVIISSTLIVLGLVGLATKGINLGVDFQAGINEQIQLAYPAGEVAFTGKGNAELTVSETQLTLVFSGAEAQKKTVTFDFRSYATLGSLFAELAKLDGISVSIPDGVVDLPSSLLVPTYQGNTLLSMQPVKLYRAPANEGERFASIDVVRDALKPLGQVSVQTVNPASLQRYLIRVRDDGSDPQFTTNVAMRIRSLIEEKVGADRVVVQQTNYVGPRFSQMLGRQSVLLVLATLVLILVYSSIRFKFEYALGAVLAIMHDALIMVAFIVWSRMEFNTTTIAAILTILGYSINDTIVQFDRVREERKLRQSDRFVDVLDTALTLTLGRSIITTITTMLAVFALYIFTSGSIKDFALALLVGLTSGVYSTIFIASAFVLFWENRKEKLSVTRPVREAVKTN